MVRQTHRGKANMDYGHNSPEYGQSAVVGFAEGTRGSNNINNNSEKTIYQRLLL
jgi:hypothetical protein